MIAATIGITTKTAGMTAPTMMSIATADRLWGLMIRGKSESNRSVLFFRSGCDVAAT